MQVTFEYYKDTYHGSKISSRDDFLQFSRKASAYLKQSILSKDTTGFETEVSDCICALSDEFFETSETSYISSVNNDGLSVSFQARQKDFVCRLDDVVSMYLANTGLLYRGMK